MTDPQNPGDRQRDEGAADNPWAPQPQQGQPTYGQSKPGQPPYGAPQYGQPQYGAPPQYGQPQTGPSYGTPQYGQPQYGGPQYGGPRYGQPQYGHPQYGDPNGPAQPSGQVPWSGDASSTGAAQPNATTPGQDQFTSMNRPPRGRVPLRIAIAGGVAAVIVVVLAFTAFVAPGFAVTKQLSQSAAESGIKSILEKDYSATDVSAVKCPSDRDIKKGDTFECTASVAGAQQKVTVTFLDDDGTYEVGRPTAD